MIKTTLKLKPILLYIYKNTNNEEYQDIFLNKIEWDILNQLLKIFEIFNKPSIKLQEEVYQTLSYSLLYIYNIRNKLISLQKEYQTLKETSESLKVS